jgi:hypothetical protein
VNNRSQPPQPAEPDMALLYLGSLFETLDYMLPPERDEAMLEDAARTGHQGQGGRSTSAGIFGW